jgi:DNA-binding LacI/PurR family transcriptional regulator
VPTVIDVARAAGVSAATVSRVLNGSTVVNVEMRERVLNAVKELDFHPNQMAQGLRRGQAKAVALLVGDIEQTHFSALTKHVQSALEEIGLDLLLFNLGHSENRLADFLQRASALRLRGIVMALSDTVSKKVGPLLASLRESGMLIVSVGQNLNRYKVPSIVHEERAAASRSVAYLLQQGRKRIAYLGRINGSAVGSERFRGYREAHAQAGLPIQEKLVWDKAFRYAAGYDSVQSALDARVKFDGLQAGSDELAMGAIAALGDRGLLVPRDVAVIGFGDVEMGAYLRPSITTLSSYPNVAAEHVREIFRLAESGAEPPPITLLQRALVKRASA